MFYMKYKCSSRCENIVFTHLFMYIWQYNGTFFKFQKGSAKANPLFADRFKDYQLLDTTTYPLGKVILMINSIYLFQLLKPKKNTFAYSGIAILIPIDSFLCYFDKYSKKFLDQRTNTIWNIKQKAAGMMWWCDFDVFGCINGYLISDM